MIRIASLLLLLTQSFPNTSIPAFLPVNPLHLGVCWPFEALSYKLLLDERLDKIAGGFYVIRTGQHISYFCGRRRDKSCHL